MILYVKMSPKNPWIVEPWHVRLAFRRSLIIVPDSAIELPENEIKGPDMSLETKEFYVVVTVSYHGLQSQIFIYGSLVKIIFNFRLTNKKR